MDTMWTETRLAQAWREAAKDLGFEFISPFRFADTEGRTRICSGLVAHFGSAMGTLIVSRDDPEPDVGDVGYELGYFTSALSPYHYETYSRETFLETLRDWGWWGPKHTEPAWLAEGFGALRTQ